MQRRTFAKTVGVIGLTTLAGCTGGDTERTVGADEGNSGSTKTTEKKDKKMVEVVSKEEYTTDFHTPGVKGKLKNVSDRELGYVGVEVKFYDSEDTRLGESLDNTEDLSAGESWAFDAAALDVDPEEYDHYKMTLDVRP